MFVEVLHLDRVTGQLSLAGAREIPLILLTRAPTV